MKIGLVATNPLNPSSFYRAFGAVTFMARDYADELVFGDPWDWAKVLCCDVIYMHCPSTDDHFDMARLCDETRTPLIVDHDDDLSRMHMGNHGFAYMARHDVQKRIRDIIDLATVVTASTPALESFLPGSFVLPNAWNSQMFPFCDEPVAKRLAWRGGPAHLHDQEAFLPAVGRALGKHQDWEFHMFGVPHWCSSEVLPRERTKVYLWEQDIITFIKNYVAKRPAIHVVPMLPTPFNKSKSNCAWIEASISGAVVVAPDWPEWDRPGVIRYKNLGDFEVVLEGALGLHDSERKKLVCESRSWITDNIQLADVNDQRRRLFQRALETTERKKI